jgi:hypothetical protein
MTIRQLVLRGLAVLAAVVFLTWCLVPVAPLIGLLLSS